MTKYREILRLTALGLSLRDIPSSVITFSRTSKKAVLPCTSRGKQASRSRLTELVIRQSLLIRIPVKLPKHGSLLVL